MKIYINSNPQDVPDEVNTVGRLIDFLKISRGGTGIGIDNRIITAANWDSTPIKENDHVTVISATYGG